MSSLLLASDHPKRKREDHLFQPITLPEPGGPEYISSRKCMFLPGMATYFAEGIEGERQKFEDTKTTNDRKPKTEANIIDNLKKEYTKTKIKEK